MGYIFKPVDIDVTTLTPLNTSKLTFQVAMQNLLSGQVLIIKNYEATSGIDTFVKLALEKPVPVTQITYTNPAKTTTAWEVYPVPVNAFSIYNVYLYDATTIAFDSIYRQGDIIKYKDENGKTLAGIIDKAYKDKDGKLYYKLTNDNTVYLLEQSGQGNYGEGTDGSKPFIPLEDITQNGSSVLVRDNRDTIRVLI